MGTETGQMQSIDVGEVWHPTFYETTLYEVVERLHPTEGGTEESAQAQVVLKHLSGSGNLIRRTVAEMFKGWEKKKPAALPMDVVLALAHDVKVARAELERAIVVSEEAARAVRKQGSILEELQKQYHVATQELLK